ncbi:hypothetical protein ACE6H2_015202 [Prunus campanulata]
MLLATLDLACLELKTFTFLSLVDCGFDYAVKVAAGVSLADTEELYDSDCSTAGCPFGESCHFLHYVPGGYNAVAQMMNLAPAPQASRNIAPLPSNSNGSMGTWQAHLAQSHDDPRAMGPGPGRMTNWMEPPLAGPASSFGASSTAKISVDASLAGAIIGKGGVNSKQICRQTSAKLSIREHESDPNLRNIELEGTFEQIQQASAMVRELIVTVSMSGPAKTPGGGAPGAPAPPGINYKTKLCDNFTKGTCTFGERCHFAHGTAELQKSGM